MLSRATRQYDQVHDILVSCVEVNKWLRIASVGSAPCSWVLGLANVVVSLIFLMVGNIPIGATFLGSGVVFIAIGMTATRKAVPPNESPSIRKH